MTESGNPCENAIAERVNGILKTEWNLYELSSHNQAIKNIKQAISNYNNNRPHMSIDMLTPQMAHLKQGQLNRLWKNYWVNKYSIINYNQKSLT